MTSASITAASSQSSSWEPPLLSWKGMQSWSVGCRAPSLCKMFVSFKSKKLRKLIIAKRKNKRKREGEGDPNEGGRAVAAPVGDSPPRSSLQLPRLSEAKRHSYHGSPSPSSNNANMLRRNSDAAPPTFPRLSTSSSSGYERVSVEYQAGGLDLPRVVKLGGGGGRHSDESGPLPSAVMNRQDSAVSARRHSSCSAGSFVSSTSLLLKGGAYARRVLNDNGQQQPHISHLFTGNQFLTHVTAAPVPTSAYEHADMRPSGGLLDASLRCRVRDAELKDRIVFFL